jgi:hypothetical protein
VTYLFSKSIYKGPLNERALALKEKHARKQNHVMFPDTQRTAHAPARQDRAGMPRHRETKKLVQVYLLIELLRSIKMMFFVLLQTGECLRRNSANVLSLSPSPSLSLLLAHACKLSIVQTLRISPSCDVLLYCSLMSMCL